MPDELQSLQMFLLIGPMTAGGPHGRRKQTDLLIPADRLNLAVCPAGQLADRQGLVRHQQNIARKTLNLQ